jgi:UDP-N-acetylglucosamine--N-acetylmuramyl-(pentapeptide) pyrophosphoryl-undecaprenol N-acetylglucosamine transferase
MKRRIVISGIGTGGHYFPALVVGRALAARKRDISFLVRPDGPEAKIARAYGLAVFSIPACGFYGKSTASKARFLWSLFRATLRLIPLTKQSVGVAFGGYGSLSLIIACLVNRRPFYLFEPNRIPGRATRLFSRRARRVFLGLPLSRPIPGRTMITGIPIRQEFKIKVPDVKNTMTPKTVLIIGGSQGARRLNQLGIELQKILPTDYRIRIISGERDFAWVDKNRNGRTEVIPFTPVPWEEFRKCEVIVSRSGALAGYEILAAGRKTIFIPFPYAVDNHQFHNAQYFAEIGPALVIEEKTLTQEILADVIRNLAARKPVPVPGVILDAEQRIADEIQGDILSEEKNAG